MKSILLILLLCLSFSNLAQSYFPPKNSWESRDPSQLGLNTDRLKEAIAFAEANEYSGSRDLRIAILEGFSQEPYHEIQGPTKKRGGPTGVILKDGYIVAEWGDVQRVDMTFSVTKSYLATVAGLAVDRGLIRTTADPVGQYVWDGTFDGAHNERITWHHLLNQSSAWSGTLFGLPDWADRPPREGSLDDWRLAAPKSPGEVMEYNDVRVNVLAYSLLQVWRKPLPAVLKEAFMDPIGASTTWRWYGSANSWVELDGQRMQSVTGGGHSGGGLFINTLDHARFGLLFLRDGQWNGQQVISRSWIDAATAPSEALESYGYLWWLNRGPRKWAEVNDESIYYAAGFGGNFIVIDQKNELVIVTRWLEPNQIGALVAKVREAVR